MAARGSKSKKRSGANSASQRPHKQPVFYLDKCLGYKVVPSALKEAGATIELHTDHFAHNAPDHEWLPVVGQRGWVVLTKDSKLLSNQLEIIALLKSGAPAFVLRVADMTGEEMAAAFTAAYPEMLRFLDKFDPPFLATIARSGAISMLATFNDLIKKVD